MLAPEEFTAGSVASAPVGSLILPRTKHEETIIVGLAGEIPTAVFLSGQFKFSCHPTSKLQNWSGLVVPSVRIEVDQETAFDPEYGRSLGAAVRESTLLDVYAKSERSVGRFDVVSLVSGLPDAINERVGFTKWQVVLGRGPDKRTLCQIEVQQKT